MSLWHKRPEGHRHLRSEAHMDYAIRRAGMLARQAQLDYEREAWTETARYLAEFNEVLTEVLKTRPDLDMSAIAPLPLRKLGCATDGTQAQKRKFYEVVSRSHELLDRLSDMGDSRESAEGFSERNVFVVHGRDTRTRDAMFAFLRSIDLWPLEWSEAVDATGKPSPYVGEVLDRAFAMAQAIVVLMTPEDSACLLPEFRSDQDPPHETRPTPQARQNVIFEAGMAMGRAHDKTVIVEVGALRPFSDIGGRHVIRMNDSTQRRQELAERLQKAGCPVRLGGTAWHSAGTFLLSATVAAPRVPRRAVAKRI